MQGKNMLYGCTKNDYTVTVAEELCIVDTVYSSQLLCLPPKKRPQVGVIHVDGAPPVIVSSCITERISDAKADLRLEIL